MTITIKAIADYQTVQIGTASGIYVQQNNFYELLWTENVESILKSV